MGMSWQDVGDWLKKNAGSGAALVGSLLTGNIPGAVAAGVSLVTSATGEADPAKVLASLQQDPATIVRLREIASQDEASIREHIRAMAQLEAEDAQAEQHETQETIRAGDKAEDRLVRWTRPLQSWLSLGASIGYAIYCTNQGREPSLEVLGAFLALPLAYAGLRHRLQTTQIKAAVNK